MMISLAFSVSCLSFLIILAIFYFSKKKIISIDNKIYTALLITNLIGIFIDVLGFFSFRQFGNDFFLNIIISKVYLIYYLAYVFIFFLYIYNVSFNNLKKIFTLLISTLVFASLLIFVLPISVKIEGNIAYSYGLGVNLSYIFGFGYVAAMMFCLIKNIKRIKQKEYITLLVFVALTLITIWVQRVNPQMTLLLLSNSVVTFLMYFTIENPDLQVLEEYHEIKELNTKRNIDKEQEIYNLRQRVRFPVMEIEERSKYLIEKMDNQELKDEIREIENLSKSTLLAINNLMNVDKMDNYYLKKVNDKYDPKLLFEQALRAGKIVHDIKYSYHIDSNIPDYLLGDGLHLKNVLKKLLEISLTKTTEGMVHVNITTIIKNDICRLFIELTDTSKGYSNSQLENIYKVDGPYFEIKQILDNIGGSIVINSEKGTGNDIIITIDQKVFNESNTKLEKLNKEYQKERVLVVTQDKKAIKDIESVLKKSSYDYEIVHLGVECLKRIRNHDQYGLIILDSNTEPLNGMEIYTKLLEIKDFNTPVIMMTDNASFKLKNYYLENGIKDIISLPIDKKQALTVINNIKND